MDQQQIAYCVSCKDKTVVNEPRLETTQNNRKMIKGYCSACEGKVSAFISNEKANEIMQYARKY